MTVEIVLLPDPYTMDWQPWAETVAGYNPGLASEVSPDDPWEEFAQRFCEAVPTAPQPGLFDTWQDWAAALKLALKT
jgi:hypothetical protein